MFSFSTGKSKFNFVPGVGFLTQRFGERCEPNLLTKFFPFLLGEGDKACPELAEGGMGFFIYTLWAFILFEHNL